MIQPYNYKVKSIVKVVDGDTVDLIVDLGFDISHKIRVRLNGYDAPETYRPKNDAEYQAGLKVKTYLATLLSSGTFMISSTIEEVYNRWGGTIYKYNEETPIKELESINNKVLSFMIENKLTKKDLGLL